MMMQRGLYLPAVGPLSDPRVLAEIAASAEEYGWDGLFLWDHLLRPIEEPAGVADPWVALTAIAAAKTRLRIGPMITPIARRRPLKLAREVASLDLFSRGRLTLGLGLGVDAGGEFSRTGDEVDPKVRGEMLDEGVRLLDQLLRGERVVHRGKHYTLDGVSLGLAGVQQPRTPFWMAARGHALAPVRRAARYEGLVLLRVTPDRFSEIVACVRLERGSLEGFDFAIWETPDYSLADYEERGATWALCSPFQPITLTTEARTSSVYDLRPRDAVEYVMSVVSGVMA
jgi:alkanesulfonate monooxygenase SsuD/methylene tetrahydromethanopterin reductase-like flavin-dependent oxidoreductase (luciferase family)